MLTPANRPAKSPFSGEAKSPFSEDSAGARPVTSTPRSKSGNIKSFSRQQESNCFTEFKKHITFVHLKFDEDDTQGALLLKTNEILAKHQDNIDQIMILILDKNEVIKSDALGRNRFFCRHDRKKINSMSNTYRNQINETADTKDFICNNAHYELKGQHGRISLNWDLLLKEAENGSVLKTKIMKYLVPRRGVENTSEDFVPDFDSAAFRAIADENNEPYRRFSLVDIADHFSDPAERDETVRKAFPFATPSIN